MTWIELEKHTQFSNNSNSNILAFDWRVWDDGNISDNEFISGGACNEKKWTKKE